MKIISEGTREFNYLDNEFPLILDYQIIEYIGKDEEDREVVKEVIVFDLNKQQHVPSKNYFIEKSKQSLSYRYASVLKETAEGDKLDRLPQIFLGVLGDLSKYTPEQILFMLLHEIGHLEHPEHKGGKGKRNQDHEIEADTYALNMSKKLAQPALEFLKEMEQTLEKKAEIRARIKNIEDNFLINNC